MQYHPDRNPGDKHAEERFTDDTGAYAVLPAADKRAHFARFGTPGPAAGGGFTDTGFGTLFEDIFETFFSGGARSSRRSRAARGEDLQYELKITLEEAAAGVETKIQIPRLEPCDACRGTGVEAGSRLETCDLCHGRGEGRRTPGFLTVAQPRPQCQGAGQLNRPPRTRGRGEGRPRAARLLSVKVPAGIEDGMQLRVSGEGSGGANGGPPGGPYRLLRIREHEGFVRAGARPYLALPRSLPPPALGAA